MTNETALPCPAPLSRHADRVRRPVLRVRLTALVVAAGLAVVTIAPRAEAQVVNENVAGWIAGAVALGLIAKAIEDDRQRDRERRREATRNPVHEPVVPDRVRDPRPLPAQCLTTYRVRGGTVDYLPAACLDSRYRDADRLPAACRQTIRTRDGEAAVYVPGCLTDRGFRIERAEWRDDRAGRDHGWQDGHRNPWDIPGQHWR
ncbi:MAG: hypothetical protein MUF73_14230 [Rhodobacteraceae bacterium]|jgi:hypothetical protein|nr:hypothetical protein [Paracoccaceae bacterium]